MAAINTETIQRTSYSIFTTISGIREKIKRTTIKKVVKKCNRMKRDINEAKLYVNICRIPVILFHSFQHIIRAIYNVQK